MARAPDGSFIGRPPDAAEKKQLRREIGRRMRWARRHGGRTQVQMAAVVGICTRSYSNYEIGQAAPPEVLLRFIVATRTNPEWLLTGTGSIWRVGPSPSSFTGSA